MQTDILHSLQRTVSDHPGEHAWIVHVQVLEPYWIIIKEIQMAQACLRRQQPGPGLPDLAARRRPPGTARHDLAFDRMDDAQRPAGHSFARGGHVRQGHSPSGGGPTSTWPTCWG